MSKLPKEKRDKMILVCFVTLVASVAIWFLMINAQNRTLKQVRLDAEKARDQLARGQTTLKTQAQVDEVYEEVSARLGEREEVMAAPNDMYSWLIQTVNKFRAGHKVEIPQFGREVPVEVGTFAKFPYRAALFNLNGSAYYHDFGKFLAAFENTFPYIRVQNIELAPMTETAGAAGSHEKLNFKMELVTLVKPVAP
jgi:Tfp pilus assembly protein PilO